MEMVDYLRKRIAEFRPEENRFELSKEISGFLREERQNFRESNDFKRLENSARLGKFALDKGFNDMYVANAYGWILYDLCFKRAITVQELTEAVQEIVQWTEQQVYSPYEQFIWNTVALLEKEPSDQKELILRCINKLNHNQLESLPYRTDDGKEIASKREKWFSKQIKLRYELKMYESCITATETMLKEITHFHHDNNHWGKRRMALCYRNLGQNDHAKKILTSLLIDFDNAFIYADLMELYLSEGEQKLAMAFGANAVVNKSGELKHKLKVLETLGDLYKEIDNRIAFSHYQLVQQVREKENWPLKSDLVEKMQQLSCDSSSVLSQRQLLPHWQQSAYSIYPKHRGKIIRIIEDSGVGFIESKSDRIFFSMRSNRQLKNPPRLGAAVSFYVKPSFDRKRQQPSTEAIGIEIMEGKG